MSTHDAERLAAGLAEDERIATGGAKYEGKDWRESIKPGFGESSVWDDDGANDVGSYMMPETATFVARNDPRRALADIAAKRRILALHETFSAEARSGRASAVMAAHALEPVIAALAAVYSGAEETVT